MRTSLSFISRLFTGISLSLFLTTLTLSAQNVGEAPAVSAAKVEQTTGEVARSYVGTVVPIEEVEVVARVSGTLEKRMFTEGAKVVKGEQLYQLEDITYKAAVDTLKANKMKAEAQLMLAESEFNRRDSLFKKKVLTETEIDTVRCTYMMAKASLAEINAQLIDAENNLSYTKILAMQSGMISRSNFSEGNLVNPGCGPLATIKQLAPIYVRFSLSAKIFQRDFGGMNGIKNRADVTLLLADGSLYSEHAKVTLIDNKINTTTDSITLWATFQNKDAVLIPGAFVTVKITPVEQKTAPAIPASALMIGADNSYSVYVIKEDNSLEQRKVTLGSTTTQGLQIITSGLTVGENIVIDGWNKVVPGGKCTPVFAK